VREQSYHVTINGRVQGVGFRPFIYRLAQSFNLYGSISNSTTGVEIFINSNLPQVEQFLDAIRANAPTLSTIDTLRYQVVAYREFHDFRIVQTSNDGEISINIPPDITLCDACREELFDPTNRRYGYPFITCTNCGVRYSIIYDLPYDRVHTSMRLFPMCDACQEEYTNPLNRRYHTQPIGCWECGVTLKLMGKGISTPIENPTIEEIVQLLYDGNIVAIKGVGGYHLVCDATNKEAIARLRERKQRPTKPFAVMTKDIEMAKSMAYIDPKEEALLTSKERPIVLLRAKKSDESIAPNLSYIGILLPYTPLHLLILEQFNRPLIATSANLSGEPIATTYEGIQKLSRVYDYVVEHTREIVNGCDDSVVMVVQNQLVTLRLARGYTPIEIKLPVTLDKRTIAVGANQKNTVAMGWDNRVVLSPYIGDLEGIDSIAYFKDTIERLQRIYRFTPEVVVSDRHPAYESTKYAQSLGLPHSMVQHHYAHILGVMAERGITQTVFGVAFDGTGLGEDGHLWGGEFLLCDYTHYRRVAHLDYFRLLGATKAIKEPRRVALSLLFEIYGEKVFELDTPTVQAFSTSQMKSLYLMWEKGLNAPLSSSMGRLFDAVASLRGICQVMHFEGESGMLLEAYYDSRVVGDYPFEYHEGRIDLYPMLVELVAESDTTIAVSKFFHTLVQVIVAVYAPYQSFPLVLTGGVFQNRVLLSLVLEQFPQALIPHTIPPNDGGIALGQIVYQASSSKSSLCL